MSTIVTRNCDNLSPFTAIVVAFPVAENGDNSCQCGRGFRRYIIMADSIWGMILIGIITADSIRYLIRTQTADSQVATFDCANWQTLYALQMFRIVIIVLCYASSRSYCIQQYYQLKMNNHSLFVMWLQLGIVMFQGGNHKEALQNFEHVLRFNPKHRVCLADI